MQISQVMEALFVGIFLLFQNPITLAILGGGLLSFVSFCIRKNKAFTAATGQKKPFYYPVLFALSITPGVIGLLVLIPVLLFTPMSGTSFLAKTTLSLVIFSVVGIGISTFAFSRFDQRWVKAGNSDIL